MALTETIPSDDPRRRSVNINLRAPAPVRDLIDRAAEAVGKTRSEFMLESARRSAEDVLLDRCLFVLDEARFEAFVAALDDPPPPSAALKKLMATRAPWEA